MEAENPYQGSLNNFSFKDYLMVLSPTRETSSDGNYLKWKEKSPFRRASKFWARPKISLCRFLMPEYLEATLHQELTAFIGSKQNLLIGTTHQDRYIDGQQSSLVLKKQTVQSLQRKIFEVLKKKVKVSKAFTKKLRNPHLPLAIHKTRQLRLSSIQFNKQKRSKRFAVAAITICSRPYAYKNTARWATLFEVPLYQSP